MGRHVRNNEHDTIDVYLNERYEVREPERQHDGVFSRAFLIGLGATYGVLVAFLSIGLVVTLLTLIFLAAATT